jgi:DNA (cytosine-5)-methyltransferase 1
MKVLDLFSGIGGFSLGLEAAGMETIAFCEFDKHAQKVLKKHWPCVPIHDDIRTLDGKQYRGTVDVICGGFPCQDLSVAGKQAGFDGERSSLYTEMLRVISECGPRYAIFENVAALITGEQGRWFAQFLYDLAKIGYDAEWHCISASELGAHHHRDRVWIIAYPNDDGSTTTKERQSIQKGNGRNAKRQKPASESERLSSERVLANANVQRCERKPKISHLLKQQVKLVRSNKDTRKRFNLSEPALCGANDGVSGRSHRLKQLGNAVVPAITEAIGRAILAV